MDKSEFKCRKKRIMAKFRQAKSRILHGNQENGFASPIFDVRLALRQLQKEKKVELAKLHRQFHGLDPDPFDREFNKFESDLKKAFGDSDLQYRRYGFKNGKPNKVGVFVDPNVCPKHGYRLPCPICNSKENEGSLEWLKMK